MSFEQMKHRIAAKNGKAELLKTFHFILCDNRLRRGMAHLFGEEYLRKRKIIPVRVFQNDLDAIISNIKIQMASSHVVFTGTSLYVKEWHLIF